MSFFDNLKKGAIEAALKAFDGYAVSVSEAQLNSLAATLARSGEPPITIICQPGAITIGGEAKVTVVPLTYSTRLALDSFEISPARKTLTLRRLDNIDLGGNNLVTALFARIVKVLLCGLFGIDPARFVSKKIAGISTEKVLITADLDVMGATEIILEAIKAKLPAALIPLLDSAGEVLAPRLGTAGNALMARIGLDDIVIEAGAISGKLRIHPASND